MFNPKLFPVTRAKVGLGSRHFNLMRGSGWTTNGFWAMPTAWEPNMVAELKETAPIPENLVKKLIDDVDVTKLDKVEITEELLCQYDRFALKLKGPTYEAWINPYYLVIFSKMRVKYSRILGNGPLKTIYLVDNQNNKIGLIMPMRVSGQYEKMLKENGGQP